MAKETISDNNKYRSKRKRKKSPLLTSTNIKLNENLEVTEVDPKKSQDHILDVNTIASKLTEKEKYTERSSEATDCVIQCYKESDNTSQAQDETKVCGDFSPVRKSLHYYSLQGKELVRGAFESQQHKQDSVPTDDIQAEARGNITICEDVEEGPKFYNVSPPLVSALLMPNMLPEAFAPLFPFARESPSSSQSEADKLLKLQEFVGGDLTGEQFDKLKDYCSPEHLRSGAELSMEGPTPDACAHRESAELRQLQGQGRGLHLHTLRRLHMRINNDLCKDYTRWLKYVSVNTVPQDLTISTAMPPNCPHEEPLLTPGQDLLFHVRVYSPFPYHHNIKHNSFRWPRFVCEFALSGRETLASLRSCIVCPNDVGLRTDVSDDLDRETQLDSKDVFPSGFLFVGNVFYDDMRHPNSREYSAEIRSWASRHGLGVYKHMRAEDVRLDRLRLRLGHPEVYVHQGNCEHLFTFSDVRLVTCRVPRCAFPSRRSFCNHQTVNCTVCSMFPARWLAAACSRLPFDPCYMCDTCLRSYLYKDGKKICDFKVYEYRFNEMIDNDRNRSR